MSIVEFSPHQIHTLAACSCGTWVAVAVGAHLLTPLAWHGYSRLSFKEKLAWCNRIASASHALLVVFCQMPNILDPELHADPINAVSRGHYVWGSVVYGYLLYDTTYLLVFYGHVGNPAFLVHHCLGLLCCAFGLYWHKLALFGMVIQVFFEGTTPLLHVMGCMKAVHMEGTKLYLITGLVFVAQFFLFRVVIANYFWWRLMSAARAASSSQVCAWGGVVVYGLLSALNLLWFSKLLKLAARNIAQCKSQSQQSSKHGAVACDVRVQSSGVASMGASKLGNPDGQHSPAAR